MINLDVIDYLIVNIKVERKKKNENGIIMDNNKKFDQYSEGNGYSKIVGWNVVNWVEDKIDGFYKLIVRDREKVDIKEGEEVKFVGRIIYENE